MDSCQECYSLQRIILSLSQLLIIKLVYNYLSLQPTFIFLHKHKF